LFYTGLQDGRIVRFRADSSLPETFVNTMGRPLGMQFDREGNLIVADAFRGLLSITAERILTVLTDSAGGERLLFPDDLDIAPDGAIWFSNASQRFDQHHWRMDFLETRPTGSLLRYDPRTRQTTVVLDRLMFANGVAIGPAAEYVLVNETIAARVTRLWISGPKAGIRETLINLPGYPDNLSSNGRGTFWVALPGIRNEGLERTWDGILIRRILTRLPEFVITSAIARPYSWVIGIDGEGKVRCNLQDSTGASGTVTSANEFDGVLYLGSITTSFVSKYSLQSVR
jgi:sugar lactone lactonase YvrE